MSIPPHAPPPGNPRESRMPRSGRPSFVSSWNISGVVRRGIDSGLRSQQHRATAQLGVVASAIRRATEELREHHRPRLADSIDRAADRIERWSSSVESIEARDVLNAVGRFARRRPVVFVGVAFGAGLLLAQLLEHDDSGPDAGRRRYRSRSDWGSALETEPSPEAI